MSNNTISTIKLRLNNNLKIKQSKNEVVSALSNRMYANSQTSDCNDYLANCCNCCTPPNVCNCCPCLSGFIVTITGVADLECGCQNFNVVEFFIPNGGAKTDLIPSPLFNEEATCYAGGWSPIGSYDCGFTNPVELGWVLMCLANGNLALGVTAKVVDTNSAETGEVFWIFYPESCDDLNKSGPATGVSHGRVFQDYCNLTGANVEMTPVFGGVNVPPECQCCRPERCESSEPGCINPYPDNLTFNFNDNCDGPSTINLSRTTFFDNSLCWIGNYNVVCVECEFGYTIGVMLCCDGGEWSLFFFPTNNFDSFVWDNLFEGYGTAPNSDNLMYLDNCDPISLHSNNGFCKTKTVNCPGPVVGAYCMFSFTITE